MIGRYTFFVIVFMSIFLMNSAVAGKVYKWVDENGVVQYSQTPPSVSSDSDSSADVNVMKKEGSSIKPRKRGKYFYCGDARLPKLRDDPARAISQLKNSILDWQYRIEKVRERNVESSLSYTGEYNSYSAQSRHRQLRQLDKQVAGYQCRIDWAEAKLKEYAEDEKEIAGNHQELTEALGIIETRRLSECGRKPTGFVEKNEEYRVYRDCIRPFEREERRLKNQLRTVKRNLELIENE